MAESLASSRVGETPPWSHSIVFVQRLPLRFGEGEKREQFVAAFPKTHHHTWAALGPLSLKGRARWSLTSPTGRMRHFFAVSRDRGGRAPHLVTRPLYKRGSAIPMVIDGRSSSLEAICLRSGGVVSILAKEVLVCLNGVMATPLRKLEQVIVLSTRYCDRERLVRLWQRGRPIART